MTIPSPADPGAARDGAGSSQPKISLIDWDFARQAARRLAPAGPKIEPAEAAAVVADLRRASAAAHGPVAETSRLQAPADAHPALVVDRGAWVDANTATFEAMFSPVVDKVLARQLAKTGTTPPPLLQAFGGKVTGAEVAGLLAFLSTKILGQYDLAPGRGADSARLLLVAPNIVEVERDLEVDPTDFRMWVCLHEETHRVQFTAVPWLRQHMVDRTNDLVVSLAPDPEELLERLKAFSQNLQGVFRPGSSGLIELFTTPEQRAQIDQVGAVMALLEGHADVVMDDVGPAVIPTVQTIRERFERRRDGLGFFDVVIRRLLGLEAKMNQYRHGAGFVRGVIGQVGWDGFNAVWTGPHTLPTPQEITEPGRWVARVHG